MIYYKKNAGWRRCAKGPPRIVVEVPLFRERLRPWHNAHVCLYGTQFERTTDMVVCDQDFAIRYPQILPNDRRQQLLDGFKPSPVGGKVVLRHAHSGLLNPPHRIPCIATYVYLRISHTYLILLYILYVPYVLAFDYAIYTISFSVSNLHYAGA